jgi:hypothetical protein
MVDKPNQPVVNECAQRPTSGLSRNDQMAARRDFEIWKSKDFALQANAAIQFIDGYAFANNDVCQGHEMTIRSQLIWKIVPSSSFPNPLELSRTA